jgi:tRNA pseudouridine(38-40) synthase
LNANINTVVTGQTYKRDGVDTINILSSMFTKNERKLRALCGDWARYYEPQRLKNPNVILYYDSTAKQGGAYALEEAEDTRFYNVVKKEYVYKIRTSSTRDPFLAGRVLEYGREISPESFEKMQKGASFFVGTHKFDAFMSTGSKIEDTTRTVHKCYLTRKGDIVEFHVVADGFLYNMVRIMVGTLLDIEKGKINESTVPWIINLRERKNAGATARPDGLYLKKVYYK